MSIHTCVIPAVLACVVAVIAGHSIGAENVAHSINTADDSPKPTDGKVVDTKTMEIKMKGAHPSSPDSYLCSSYSLDDLAADENYIVQFEAMADVKTAHHILLYGCDGEPARDTDIWRCPAVCRGIAEEQIIFAWAKAAPPTRLPKDVGFRVGRASSIKTIVLQVHYKHKFSETTPRDYSGIRIYLTAKRQKYVAGIHLMASYSIVIPPNTPKTHSDISCVYRGPKPMHPFAYRTHAHSLGKVITGYVFNDTWYEIGKGNPQWPQAFYPVNGSFVVNPGDGLAARCTFDSTGRNRVTNIGATGADEMCNFYIMYYTDSSVKMPSGQCGGNRQPKLMADIPDDSDVPLPPNPDLEEEAKGHHHHAVMATQAAQTVDQTGNDMPYLGGQGYSMQEDYPDYSLYSQYLKNLGPLRNQKRFGQDYYDDLDAYSRSSFPRNRNRNRNKAFEAMNRQLSEVPQARQPSPKNSDSEYKSRGYVARPTERPRQGGRTLSSSADHGSQSEANHQPVDLPDPLVFDGSWPAQQLTLGQIGGIATDKDGNVYIFHRGSRQWDSSTFDINNKLIPKDPIPENVVIILDKKGKLVRQFGSNQFYMPHGIEVDSKGNIWLTDIGLHQVMRIPKGTSAPDLVLGKQFEPDSDNEHFCKPADIAVLESGDFFVADGYCNSRVLKFSANGTLLDEWGQADFTDNGDAEAPQGVFNIVHSVTVAEDKKLVCVADRENGRIQCFDLDGNFRFIIKNEQMGPRVFAIEYCPLHGGVLFAVNGPTYDGKIARVQGFTIALATGDLLQTWDVPNGLQNPHDVTVDSTDHAVYVGELDPHKVWRLSMNAPKKTDTVIDVPDKKGFAGKPKDTSDTTGTIIPPSAGTSNSSGEITQEKKSAKDKKSDYMPSIIIGVLLIVPVVLLLVVTVIIRLHHSGKISCFSGKKQKVFSLQSFLGNSHKGFDRLSTEESDHELDPLDDSDQEEYTAPSKKQRA
ncbi:peptidyl-glycine alpha-amidating monooxygenase B-like isoform X1 [Haliotis cracherodii]|uniref:peptidyl-glycine alpha-amidating monooxygenase B-like isoform X1 n=1 Tax=Haliotis cracherodii TaxID=6455 RepID=UPI0039EB4508